MSLSLSNLQPAKGSNEKRYRKGRGHASGNGKQAGKGDKGQKARTGSPRIGFEGGQMPLYRRIPKRGFKNVNYKEIVSVNVSTLNRFEDGASVCPQAMIQAGIFKNPRDGVKILGSGTLTKKLTVIADAFSETAKEKIEAAGGKAVVRAYEDK